MDLISVDQLHENFQNLGENNLILDVRSQDEFDEGHIPGARHTPHEEVASIADELKTFDKVYVHCKMGGRAKIASQTLKGTGLENIVCVGDGGMQRWTDMGWELEE
jgi:rhodanese-related sulfurtransferase